MTYSTVLHLSVRDDGIGGTDPTQGSGILDLTDRVEALGGTLELVSPVRQRTALHVTLPLADDWGAGGLVVLAALVAALGTAVPAAHLLTDSLQECSPIDVCSRHGIRSWHRDRRGDRLGTAPLKGLRAATTAEASPQVRLDTLERGVPRDSRRYEDQ